MLIIDRSTAIASPFIESITQGFSVAPGTIIRPAETHCHLVISKRPTVTEVLFVGPWHTAGQLSYGTDAEMLWVRLRLGTRLAHMPTSALANTETVLPHLSVGTVAIGESVHAIPRWEDLDIFIHRLERAGVFRFDPVIQEAVEGCMPKIAPRTLRQRFLDVTGQSLERIHQVRRATQAAELLSSGHSIADVIDHLGYYDQPHLTRTMKRYIGFTPGSLIQ